MLLTVKSGDRVLSFHNPYIKDQITSELYPDASPSVLWQLRSAAGIGADYTVTDVTTGWTYILKV